MFGVTLWLVGIRGVCPLDPSRAIPLLGDGPRGSSRLRTRGLVRVRGSWAYPDEELGSLSERRFWVRDDSRRGARRSLCPEAGSRYRSASTMTDPRCTAGTQRSNPRWGAERFWGRGVSSLPPPALAPNSPKKGPYLSSDRGTRVQSPHGWSAPLRLALEVDLPERSICGDS
jgi:hypothetical protein